MMDMLIRADLLGGPRETRVQGCRHMHNASVHRPGRFASLSMLGAQHESEAKYRPGNGMTS